MLGSQTSIYEASKVSLSSGSKGVLKDLRVLNSFKRPMSSPMGSFRVLKGLKQS